MKFVRFSVAVLICFAASPLWCLAFIAMTNEAGKMIRAKAPKVEHRK